MDIDISNLTLAGLAIIGAVNAATIFRPGLSSRSKFIISFAAALAVTFIPADLGALALNHVKDALIAAFAASGGYKLTQNVGSLASPRQD